MEEVKTSLDTTGASWTERSETNWSNVDLGDILIYCWALGIAISNLLGTRYKDELNEEMIVRGLILYVQKYFW